MRRILFAIIRLSVYAAAVRRGQRHGSRLARQSYRTVLSPPPRQRVVSRARALSLLHGRDREDGENRDACRETRARSRATQPREQAETFNLPRVTRLTLSTREKRKRREQCQEARREPAEAHAANA